MTDTSFDPGEFYERELSPHEVEQRKNLTLDLMGERDDLLSAVDEKRLEIRRLNAQRKKLDSRTAQLRREIRSRKVLEPRQTEMVMPPGEVDSLETPYRLAQDTASLRVDLSIALQGVCVPSVEQLSKWPPGSPTFDLFAHWARREIAHMNANASPSTDPALLSASPRLPMPKKLAVLRNGLLRAMGPAGGKARKPRKNG